ncbi:F0F1 ATP synthase subunit delta [Frigoribacterium sp. CFBP9039]|uniref:F0F1 ATP synthase subunit delta n=1 Tax=Frigoribacterium TaxID=96492 RepID=UPI00177FB6B4|nr:MULTISPECIES: F0F1 ATP synthase subunit delta [Frigoribacterium]MBD8702257.1 F0F1 ATP synthase subunit delta [Frigoribacterium sp. CFBP 13712]MDY0892873.1 F0F1 ATP synthase subunit delta [Frigoribacterium sp. CFBP9030]MDY0946928.1 F0F1 ATP synthase subunit delta [Frigoribacterium sp. CFBP9039]
MGSMSREALGSARSVLSDLGGAADLATGEQLLDAGRVIGGSVQLQAYFADPSTDVVVKKQLVDRLFGSFSEAARALLVSVVGSRWSSSRDLLAGIEELGFRVIALSAPGDSGIENELFAFDAVVRSDAQLELAIGTKLSDASSKAGLVQRLLGDKASPQTLAIVSHLVRQPRGRRIGELLRTAADIVADQSDQLVATVTSATRLDSSHVARLEAGLARQFGRNLRINQVIDPAIIGGLRVQVGDEVIDGTVATKLSLLRLQLAG